MQDLINNVERMTSIEIAEVTDMRENFPSSKELSKQATERRDKFLTTP